MSVNTDPAGGRPYDATKGFHPCAPVDVGFFEAAPQVFVQGVDLPVSPAVLFDILEDPVAWTVWGRPGIKKVTWTSPAPYRVGTTRTVNLGGLIDVYEHFFLWERGKEMGFYFYGTTARALVAFAERYAVTDLGEGTCRLTWTLAYDPGGFMRTIGFLFRPWVWMAMKLMMRNLRKYCQDLEGGP